MKKGTFLYRFLVVFLVWAILTTGYALFFFRFLEFPTWAKIVVGIILLAALPLSMLGVELAHRKRKKENDGNS